MRKLPIYLTIIALAAIAWACNDANENWDKFEDWRKLNMAYIQEQELRTNPDGTPYYTKIVPDWDPDAYVLIHFFNDRSKTVGNLSPLYTSTVDVKYYGQLYDDQPFDSSYNLRAEYGDSIYRTTGTKVIEGWFIALENMRVGDTAEVIIPYHQGYGAQGSGAVIKPYSTLKFGIKLVDIPFYNVRG